VLAVKAARTGTSSTAGTVLAASWRAGRLTGQRALAGFGPRRRTGAGGPRLSVSPQQQRRLARFSGRARRSRSATCMGPALTSRCAQPLPATLALLPGFLDLLLISVSVLLGELRLEARGSAFCPPMEACHYLPHSLGIELDRGRFRRRAHDLYCVRYRRGPAVRNSRFHPKHELKAARDASKSFGAAFRRTRNRVSLVIMSDRPHHTVARRLSAGGAYVERHRMAEANSAMGEPWTGRFTVPLIGAAGVWPSLNMQRLSGDVTIHLKRNPASKCRTPGVIARCR
jgi:hypothetical protein